VLGFEYGYSLAAPKSLVIWEAQFGDFANGAQIIFDQFISSSETKWLRASGLVALLPHGYEGQGPEHSSARLERFLQLAAEDNIQVVYPTTPASIFHLLRRQVLRNFRKPLIIMSPKSLLRHKLAVSAISEVADGTMFRPVLSDSSKDLNPSNVKKVIFCSGKVFYDLYEHRLEKAISDVAIVRLEQLYPFCEKEITDIVSGYNSATSFVWCQEEPSNMGAWSFVKDRLENLLNQIKAGNKLSYVGRKDSASPAVGSLYTHNAQQDSLVNEAFK
jgi:2-oxoglutarate dehydrogenase E1 component